MIATLMVSLLFVRKSEDPRKY